MKTLLNIIDEVFREMGLGQGLTAALSSQDNNVQQLVAIFQSVGEHAVLDEPYVIDLPDGRWVVDPNGSKKSQITTDDDTFLIDDVYLKQALTWMWKYNKGLEYGEDHRSAVKRINYEAFHRQAKDVHY